MQGVTLRSRAATFALCAGGVAFFLALLVTANGSLGMGSYARALIPALVCAAMCWAAAQQGVTETAGAIDRAVERLSRAAEGDLDSAVPEETRTNVPQLAIAMDGLFHRLKNSIDNIEQLALFDPVTGLANRTSFRGSAERILAETPHPAALFFIDLDRFKTVNDTRGHACGDMLLAMVAERLRTVAAQATDEATGTAPLIGRLAGDEFTMLLPALTLPCDAAVVGEQILRTLGAPFPLPGGDVTIGASIGVAMRPDHGHTLHDLMRAADAAMYRAKADGRGRCERFSASLAAELADRVRLDAELRMAIDRDQFTLAFQPQQAMVEGATVAAEALLRWQHPADGLRLPGTFLARAEESGLMIEIGDWVVGRVAETIARWATLGVEGRLAINISPRQIDHADFFRRLRAAMHAAGAPARLLELEITEVMAMHLTDDALAAIRALREDGALIAIDDFGTGDSNLTRLRALPIDRIKLDRTLLAGIGEDASVRAIVQAVIGLVHGLGCEAVAEGVETRAETDVLRVIGCDAIQGYAIAKPMDEAAFLAWSRRYAATRPDRISVGARA